MNKDDINSYVDLKYALMLAVLGLYETLEQFEPKVNCKYWVEDHHLCFDNGIANPYKETYHWHIPSMLRTDGVLSILKWGGGVIEYVD